MKKAEEPHMLVCEGLRAGLALKATGSPAFAAQTVDPACLSLPQHIGNPVPKRADMMRVMQQGTSMQNQKAPESKTRLTDVLKLLVSPRDPWWVRMIMLLILLGVPYRVIASEPIAQAWHWALVHLPWA